ncbi:MAG: heat-shock protein Hsp20 [Rhodospirillaceae bacterium]|nr:MAG: heat-shock protein Hsp20 [Rhodospirillaceae bacterium]
MTRFSLFNSPFLLGFDQFERTLDRVTKAANDGYPPYNIEQLEDGGLRITLAVAGFGVKDLSTAIEDNELVIAGEQKDADTARAFHHQGIATRKFQRRFVLAEGIEVTDASYDNGLLHIDLVRPNVESRTRRISIREDRTAPPQTVNLRTETATAE